MRVFFTLSSVHASLLRGHVGPAAALFHPLRGMPPAPNFHLLKNLHGPTSS